MEGGYLNGDKRDVFFYLVVKKNEERGNIMESIKKIILCGSHKYIHKYLYIIK